MIDGNWYTPTPDIPSNHRGTIQTCGEWALPVFPSNMSLVGSPKTPYIFDDRCKPEDAALAIAELYNIMIKKEKSRGKKEWSGL
jgi:hypothetical protein